MSPRILIVDDEEKLLRAMCGYFDHRGFDVDCARELDQANGLIDRKHYDVVLADLRLTGTDGVEGFEIVTHLRTKNSHTKAVLMTAYGTTGAREEAFRRGADAFLEKPLPLGELVRVVTSLLTV